MGETGVMKLLIGTAITSAMMIGPAIAQSYATYEQSAPVYEAYQPDVFDAGAYDAATHPTAVLQAVPILPAQPISVGPVYDGAANDPVIGDDFSRSLGAPETFAVERDSAASGEIGFAQESETSRLLIALEETYATRVSALKVNHLAQRRGMLDAFERQASDPNQVIGLAERMRTALAELEAVQKASLAEEERLYIAATLKVLDAAPSRVE